MMEAMVLAAGAGTRLAPLTHHIPKALVPVGDKPLLAWVLDRLAGAGVGRVVINTHYHEAKIRSFLRDQAAPTLEIVYSPEPEGPLETGGGLFKAQSLFREPHPFLLHNVDVLSDIPLEKLMEDHLTTAGAKPRLLASLAVQDREARRRLLFDDLGLIGWENQGSGRAPEGRRLVREPSGTIRPWSFTGIHVVDPRIFRLSDRQGAFSIITLYLELAAEGWVIQPVDMTGREWLDVGTPDRLDEANRWARLQ
jgi:NDP-sugar pyrophosphorylase family protein